MNTNDRVRITLKERGANLINTKRVNVRVPGGWAYPGQEIEEQLWVLMAEFGPHICMGLEPVFDTEIVVRVALPADVAGSLSTDHLLHRLWTKAVGTEGYNKAEWKELERRLAEAKATGGEG